MTTYLQFFLEALDQIKETKKSSSRGGIPNDPIEALAMIPHPSGHGSFNCGSAAYETLHRASQSALINSRKAARLDENDVFEHIKNLFSQWYLGGKKEISAASSGELVKEAVRLSSISIASMTHIYPVYLGHAKGEEEFAIGPVKFIGGSKKTSSSRSLSNNTKRRKNTIKS